MSEKWIKKSKLEKAKQLAEEHWAWLEPYFHKLYTWIALFTAINMEKRMRNEENDWYAIAIFSIFIMLLLAITLL